MDAQRSTQNAERFVDGQLIVRFRPGTSMNEQAAAVSSVGTARIARRLLQDLYVVATVPVGAEDQYTDMLSNHPAVESAEKDVIRELDTHTNSSLPNDQYFRLQWHLQAIQAEQAWDLTTGSGATVAIVDSGVAYTATTAGGTAYGQAPDLAGASFVAPYDAFNGDAIPEDDNGHGTHVTGTVAQRTNNTIGVAGVAHNASIMPVKVCGWISPPPQYACPSSAIADGITWAVNNGADVINMSLGGPGSPPQAERDAVDFAESNGVVVVAAAGNGGADGIGDPAIEYPGALPTVISTGAVRFDQTRSAYSNYGTAEGGADHLHLVAPGGDVTVDQNGDTYADGVLQNTYEHACLGGPEDFTQFVYCFYQGTSMASPHVAAVVALMKSANPSLTPVQVRETLRCSSLDLGAMGYDSVYGAGLVQAYAAVKDTDGDGSVDPCDIDDDNDLLSDASENACGGNPLDPNKIPERVDGPFAGQDDDGDTLVDEALPPAAGSFDCDGDGYIGSTEDYVYSYAAQTNGDQKTCQQYDLAHPNPNPETKPSLRWPSDFRTGGIPDSTNRINILDLAAFVAPIKYYGTNVGTNPGDVRWDVSPGAGVLSFDINIFDLTVLVAPLSSTGSPPMLSGARALNGPACPWPP
jgi:serine protease